METITVLIIKRGDYLFLELCNKDKQNGFVLENRKNELENFIGIKQRGFYLSKFLGANFVVSV